VGTDVLLFVSMAVTPKKSFRLTDEDLARLTKLQDALGGKDATNETDALRWALVALEGVLEHGLAEWTFDGPDDKRYLALRRLPGLSLMLVENDEGGFTPWHMTDIKPTHTWE
jgi:hypothetical protein